MKNKKTTLFVLAVFSAVFALSACSGSVDSETPDSGGARETAAEAAENAANEPEYDYDYDFEGYTFRVLVNGDGFADYRSREFFAEEETGDVINDAVYTRNVTAESKYNFSLEVLGVDVTNWGNPAQVLADRAVKAGDDAYDLVMPFMSSDGAPSLAQQGLLTDLKTLPGLQLDSPWWDQRANEQLSIGGKLFFTTGDISVVLNSYCTFGILFNKALINDNGLENPYTLVQNGSWTIDKMYETSKAITSDINGDGVLNHEDRWGVLSELNASNGMFFSAGERIVTQGIDGYPEFSMYNPRSVSVIAKALDFLQDETTVIFANTMAVSSVWEYATQIMAEGRALFRTCALVGVEELRAAELDFGIIPYPKYDSAQEEYNNLVSTICVPGMGVPITVQNPETVGAIIEVLARGAYETITPAYFEQTLYNRLVRDEESYDMLRLIFASRVYDLAYIYDWGGVGFLLMNMNERRQTDFASQYERIEPRAAAAMETTIELYREIS